MCPLLSRACHAFPPVHRMIYPNPSPPYNLFYVRGLPCHLSASCPSRVLCPFTPPSLHFPPTYHLTGSCLIASICLTFPLRKCPESARPLLQDNSFWITALREQMRSPRSSRYNHTRPGTNRYLTDGCPFEEDTRKGSRRLPNVQKAVWKRSTSD